MFPQENPEARYLWMNTFMIELAFWEFILLHGTLHSPPCCGNKEQFSDDLEIADQV